MRIGINTRNLIPNKMEGFGHYTFEIVSRLISAHPEHEFILFYDRQIDPPFNFGSNAVEVVVSPPTSSPNMLSLNVALFNDLFLTSFVSFISFKCPSKADFLRLKIYYGA